jgi:aldose sugar dehydrogenase
MLGIAISKNKTSNNNHTYVFLYYTAKISNNSRNSNNSNGAFNNKLNITNAPEESSVTNRLYRYEFVDGELVNPKLLLELPGTPSPRHYGGAILIGPDNNLYIPIGDVDGHISQAQNTEDGGPPDGSGMLMATSVKHKILKMEVLLMEVVC